MASDKKNKSNKHNCPHIASGWDSKISGPAYREGMTAEQARSAWFNHVRRLNAEVTKMPRRTS